MFDNFEKQVSKDSVKVLDACMKNEKVLKAYDKMKTSQHAVRNIQNEITHLLWKILKLLLGRCSPYFQPLKNALKSDVCIWRGEARHCLLLTLVVFGNLTEIDQQCKSSDLQDYHKCINDTFKHFEDSANDEESRVLRQAHSTFSPSTKSTGFFLAINHLIAAADSHDYIARFDIIQQPFWRCELERASIRQLPAHQLLSANVQVHSESVFHTGTRETSAISLQQAVDITFNSTVPSHPASAYLTKSTSLHEMESTSALQQNVSTPSDNFSPPPTPTETGVMLISQTSVDAQEGERVEDDEDLKDLSLAAPFILGRQNSVSTVQQDKSSTMLEDTSIVDEQFCRFCAISLRVDENITPLAKQEEQIPDKEHGDHDQPMSDQVEDQGEQVEIELYASHCASERHMNNMKAHEIFTKLKKEDYEPLREKLNTELQNLKDFEIKNITSNLRTVVLEIEKELECNERTLTEILNSAEWKIGASRIKQGMLGRMDVLITAAVDRLSKEKIRVQREQHLREQAARVKDEAADDGNLSDEGDGSQSEEEISKEVDANIGREKRRQQRRDRKKQTKANRHSKSSKR